MIESELKQFLDLKLYEIGNALMEYYDPCQMNENSCIVNNPNTCCIHTRFGNGLCLYQNNGCHNPNAWCKLWICRTAIQATDPKLVEGLTLLQHFGNLYGIVGRPMIGQAYVGADRPPGGK